MRSHSGLHVTLTALLLGLAGCGIQSVGGATHPAAALTCPVKLPAAQASAWAGQLRAPGDLVPRRPRAATICQFGEHGKLLGVGKITLDELTARGLAAVLNSAMPVSGYGRRCNRSARRDGLVQLARFSYTGAPSATARITFTLCPVAVVTAGRRSGQIDSPDAVADLWSYTSLSRGHGPATPDLIGLSAAGADALARRHGLQFGVDAAAIDSLAPPGSVIFQTPPPGQLTVESARQVGVIIAVRPAAACTPGQLAADYRFNQASVGNDFAGVTLRDVSVRPCMLRGPLRLAGLNPAGRPVTPAISYRVAGVTALTPQTPLAGLAKLPPGKLIAGLLVSAEYVSGALCGQHRPVPASWRIELPSGGTITVPDADPGAVNKLDPSGGLLTCRGELNRPPQPVYAVGHQPGA
jgi:hypothetical protein